MTDEERERLRAIRDAAYSLIDAVDDRLCDYEDPADLEAAFDRLFALRWQSMDSAPEAGTYLAVTDETFTLQWSFGHWDGKEWTSGDAGTPIAPTHWMPLPPEPGKEG